MPIAIKLVLSALGSALSSMTMRMLTAKALEDLIVWALSRLVANTESKADDELLAKVKEHLNAESKQ